VSRTPVFPVSEIFGPTLQGEGIHSGRVATFIRFAGCDSNCEWCDTKYAWKTEGSPMMTSNQIVSETLEKMHDNQRLVILTGGNPALYDLGGIIGSLHRLGIEVHVETQGTVFPAWLGKSDFISFSPKPTQEALRGEWIPMASIYKMFYLLENETKGQLKFIIDTNEEYNYAKHIASRELSIPMIFQPKFLANKAMDVSYGNMELANKMCADRTLSSNVRFAPQMHRILWSDKRGK